MLNYLHAELYKVLRRKYTWITLVVVMAMEALLVAGWVFTNVNGNHVTFGTGAGVLTMLLTMGLYATILTADMIFAGQYKYSTMKNEVSFGIPRARIYLGKLLAQVILAVAACVVIVAFYLALCWLTLYHDPEADFLMMKAVGYCLLVALPLWLGAQALSCMLCFTFKSEIAASYTVAAVFAVVPAAIEITALLLGGAAGEVLMTVHRYMPSVLLDQARYVAGDMQLCGTAWIVGVAWVAVTTLVGLKIFSKREIA